MTKRITKIVGYINKDIIDKYNLYEYEEKPILQSLDLYAHIEKHKKEFKSLDNYNDAILNIDKVIKIPDFVYYEKVRNTLLYFKKINENVCVVVRLTLKKNKNNYVASLYPVSEYKIQKYIEKSYIKE